MPSSDFLAHHSLYMENVLRHAFLFELSRHLLLLDPPRMVTILNAEVDDAGIDLVLTLGSVTRHIQMKTLKNKHAPNPYNIATSVFELPGGCVIWMLYDAETLTVKRYHFFGEPGNGVAAYGKLLPSGTKKKNKEVLTKEGYHAVRTKDANHQNLTMAQLVDILFEPELTP